MDATNKKIAVFEVEKSAVDGEVLLVGCYDGSDYKSFSTIQGFLEDILLPSNVDTLFCSFSTDILWVSKHMFASEFFREGDIAVSYSGSLPIEMAVCKGDLHWFFIDIGQFVSLSQAELFSLIDRRDLELRGPSEPRCHFHGADRSCLRDYNEKDLRAIYKALTDYDLPRRPPSEFHQRMTAKLSRSSEP